MAVSYILLQKQVYENPVFNSFHTPVSSKTLLYQKRYTAVGNNISVYNSVPGPRPYNILTDHLIYIHTDDF